MLVVALAVMLLTAVLARERALTAAWIVALSPLLTGAVVRTHFDLVAVALMLGALLALTRGRPTAGFALLGTGAMTKLFPALLVPVAAAWLVARRRGGDAVRGAAVFVVVVAVVSLPFLGGGYVDAYRYQLERPVQIESTPATVLFALGGSHVTGTATVPDAHGSNGLEGGAADVVQAVFAALLAATLVRLRRCSRSRRWARCSLRSSSSGSCRSARWRGRGASARWRCCWPARSCSPSSSSPHATTSSWTSARRWSSWSRCATRRSSPRWPSRWRGLPDRFDRVGSHRLRRSDEGAHQPRVLL
jgi:hypothetical protein